MTQVMVFHSIIKFLCLITAMKKILLILCTGFAIYSLAVYKYGSTTKASPTPAITKGWNVWQEKNCQSCHQLYGLGGYMGPDLTNVASEKGAAYMKGIIHSGTTRMPDFHLKEEEINDLVAFLSWVDHSGSSKVSDTSVHWTGTYTIAAP